jgi:hypothetical protein
VVSSDTFIPCYKEASLSVAIIEKPTATVGANQNNCSLFSVALGGNTFSGRRKVVFKIWSWDCIFCNVNSGSSTATVNVPVSYVFLDHIKW